MLSDKRIREEMENGNIIIEPFEPRPHWGKRFVMPADELRDRYEALPRFVGLANSLDPDGVFRNAFLDRYVFVDD